LAKKRVYELARELGMPTRELISALEKLGMPNLSAFHVIRDEEVEVIRGLLSEQKAEVSVKPAEEKPAPRAKPRPPVVAVLGHIDHGKTTLLDRIRKTHIAAEEPGGITQSIGAYQAQVDGKLITFIDTPGHRAFTAMRARGAKVTDIAILVVAADDGVMAQTLEALDHIKAAGVPMIVAINKIDKPEAKPERVKQELANLGYIPEDWGGNTIMIPISALTGQGVDELLEMILLVAEMEGISGDPEGELEAVVIESHMDPQKGPVATAIVKMGPSGSGMWWWWAPLGEGFAPFWITKGRGFPKPDPGLPCRSSACRTCPRPAKRWSGWEAPRRPRRSWKSGLRPSGKRSFPSALP